jgi:hypothetical protein
VHAPSRCPDTEELPRQFGRECSEKERRRREARRQTPAASSPGVPEQSASGERLDEVLPESWSFLSDCGHGCALVESLDQPC